MPITWMPSGEHTEPGADGDQERTGPRVIRTATVISDPDELVASSVYTVKQLHIAGDRSFTFRHTRTDLGGAYLDTLSHTGTIHADIAASPIVFVTRISRGVLDLDAGDGSQRLGPGNIAVTSQAQSDYLIVARDLHAQVVGIDVSLIRTVAGEQLGLHWLPPGEWFGRRLGPEAGRAWQRTVDYVRSVLDEQSLSTPLVVSTARRTLAATLLAATDPPSEPTWTERHDATTRTVQRAIVFIETNPDLDIGVAEIAAAAHVSPRAIQLAFRRHLGTTPSAYLRRVRLDRARADLLAAEPAGGVTVTAIAARWGFPRASRFAQQYRALYDEPPSATLRR